MNQLTFDLLMAARSFKENSDYLQSAKTYLAYIDLMEKDIELHKTEDNQVECLTTKTEYLWMKSMIGLKSNDPYYAREIGIFGLDIYHKAILINTDGPRANQLAVNERLILKDVIYRLNCVIPKNKTHYTLKCPIRIRSFMGVSATSTTIVYKNVSCSICNQPYVLCNHKAGVDYDGKIAKIHFTNGEIIDTSLVSRPREPLARYLIAHIPRSWWEGSLDPKDLRNEGLYCHFCAADNIDPNEISYDLFTDMQKPDDEINTSEYKHISNETVGGIDLSSAIGKPVYMYPEGSEFRHIPSTVMGESQSDEKEKV